MTTNFKDQPVPRDPELESRIAEWGKEALGDEEHIAIVARVLFAELTDPESITRRLVATGDITLEFAATAASLMVSIEGTDRHYGGAPVVGATVIGLLPPGLVEDV